MLRRQAAGATMGRIFARVLATRRRSTARSYACWSYWRARSRSSEAARGSPLGESLRGGRDASCRHRRAARERRPLLRAQRGAHVRHRRPGQSVEPSSELVELSSPASTACGPPSGQLQQCVPAMTAFGQPCASGVEPCQSRGLASQMRGHRPTSLSATNPPLPTHSQLADSIGQQYPSPSGEKLSPGTGGRACASLRWPPSGAVSSTAHAVLSVPRSTANTRGVTALIS